MPQGCADTLIAEEPHELIAHVRIYGANESVAAVSTQSEQI